VLAIVYRSGILITLTIVIASGCVPIGTGNYANFYRGSDGNANVNDDLIGCGASKYRGEMIFDRENAASLSSCMQKKGYQLGLPPQVVFEADGAKSAKQERNDFLLCGGKFHPVSGRPIVHEASLISLNSCMASKGYAPKLP
jgi:hypothetical protein